MAPVKLALFLLGVFCIFLAILAEIGLGLTLGFASGAHVHDSASPGFGIRMLGLIDAGLAWSLMLMTIDFVRPMAWLARVQGIITLILSLLGVIGGIVLIYLTFVLLVLMVSMLLAVPFGTIAYLVIWADFPSGQVRAALALIMLLKLSGVGLLAVGSPGLLKNKGLVILMLFSVGSTFVTGLLIALVPGIVAAIADVIGALIAAVLGTIWLLVMLIGAIFAVIRAVRSLAPG